jgi:predicted nucleic acid-binding protein
VSEAAGAAPAPYVLDVSVLIALARGDWEIITSVQRMDADGQPLMLPVLAMTAAFLDMPSEDAGRILRGIERLEHATAAALDDAWQAVRLAAVIASTGLNPWDAHVAMVADAEVCPILTLDGVKWRQHVRDLDEPLHVIEIDDPEDGG